MDPIAKTAYYCCGVRAADAASRKPICGDSLAQRFMTGEAKAIFRRFEDLTMPNRSNATRARIIDDWLRQTFAVAPERRVILLGAGFDSRAFRLAGGDWVELDHPAILAIKSGVLPEADAPNPLQRIGIDFGSDRLNDKLAPFSGERGTLVVMEGVSMYLSQEQLAATLATLRHVLPGHTLICDLMTETFARRYGGAVRQRIAELGGQFAPLVDDPAAAIIQQGYAERARTSMIGRARELGAVPIPRFMLNTFLKPLRDGYCAYMFEAAA